jgi:hypothetical protein
MLTNQTAVRIGRSNVRYAGQELATVCGVPFRTAVAYAVFFAVAFLFYSLLWSGAPILAPDSASYLRAAQDLSNFHLDQLQERAPGYPLLLLITSSSQSPNRALFFASLLLHFASIWLLATILYNAGLSPKMLKLFGLILLLPPYVEPAAYVMSENLTEAILVVAFVSMVFWLQRYRTVPILISALAIGYVGLTRPTYQLLGFAMAAYFLMVKLLFRSVPMMWQDSIRASFILICGSSLIIGGYALSNYRSFGYFGVTPKLGLTLSQKTLRVIERLPDEYAAVRDSLIRARNSQLITGPSHTGYSYIWGAVPELSKITGLPYPQLSDYMLRLNLLLIRKAPLEYFQDVVLTSTAYWLLPSGDLANLNSRSIQFLWAIMHFFLIAGFVLNVILLLGAGIYIEMSKQLLTLRNRLPAGRLTLIKLQAAIYGLAGTIIFYTAAVSCLVELPDVRYRVPTDSLILFMLFLGTHLWWRLINLSRVVFHDVAVNIVNRI